MSKKVKNIIMYVAGAVMAFSIFMFFMDVITWKDNFIYDPNAATPTFFDLMFGKNGSRAAEFNYTKVTGMLFIFVIQIIIIVSVLVLVSLTLLKKIKTNNSYLLLGVIGLLAIINAILTFLTPNFAINIWRYTEQITINIAKYTKLFYGAYVYGITMAVAGIVSLVPFIATKLSK